MSTEFETAIAQQSVPALLRDSKAPPFAMPRIPGEYSNWIDEQRSWREAACLYDQSHHMTDLTLKGPGAIPLLSSIAVNSFAKFPVDTAKQIVTVSNDGYYIGDAIIFHLSEHEYRIVGGPQATDWIHFHAETRGEDIEISRDDNSYVRQGDPEFYRYQIQGPKAFEIVEKVLGHEPPSLKFFSMGEMIIAGKNVRALRHGMAGEPGYELFGPWEDGEAVKQALLEAGADRGIRLVGGRAYLTNTLESGWIPRPVSAVYSNDSLMSEFRTWQKSRGVQLTPSLGGSHQSDDIQDYYFTPYELGYGRVVKFDHDFIGREALEKQVEDGIDQARTKVTLIWDQDDLEQAIASSLSPETGAKYLDLPMPLYSTFQFDRVLDAAGQAIGRSAWTGYSANENAMLSLATIDSDFAEPGTRVTLLWGESPRTNKLTSEPHEQVAINATVAPIPVSDFARKSYRK